MITMTRVKEKRSQILSLASQHGACNVRLFGSVLSEESGNDSDIDFLVEMEPDRSLLDRVALGQDLEDILGCKVDIVNEKALHWLIQEEILQRAVPL